LNPFGDSWLVRGVRIDRARDWQVQDLRLALAGTLRRRGLRRPAARQDAAFAHQEARALDRAARRGADDGGAAGRSHALDGRDDGGRSRRQRLVRATHLARPWASAHRGRQFKLSKDPEFVDKLRDGLYVDPRAHAVVLSVDEKSQSRPSIARPPGLPMKKGRAGTMTHDDKRHGTTTLFAAMLGALERDAGSALAPPARLRRPTTDPRRGPRKDHVVLLREAEKQVDMAAYVLTTAPSSRRCVTPRLAGRRYGSGATRAGRRVAPNSEIVSGYPFARERARRT
jgi:hypothetical protein